MRRRKSRRKVANERVVQGKTSPVALASRDACGWATGRTKRSQRHSRAVYGAPKTSFCGGRPCPDKGKAIVMSNINGESDVTPTESKTTGTGGNFSYGSRETPAASASPMEADRSEKARGHTSDRHVAGESDSSIVPKKPTNKGSVPLPAEWVEGRELPKENAEPSLLDRTQRRNADGTPFVPRSRGWLGVREAAQKDKKLRFTSLLHHITSELLFLKGKVEGNFLKKPQFRRKVFLENFIGLPVIGLVIGAIAGILALSFSIFIMNAQLEPWMRNVVFLSFSILGMGLGVRSGLQNHRTLKKMVGSKWEEE